MINRGLVIILLFSAFLCSDPIAQATEATLDAQELIQRADPHAKIEYGGAISTRWADYYLFLLKREELAGTALVQQRIGATPIILAADTSLFPFREEAERLVEKPVQNGIKLLLRRRTAAKEGHAAPVSSNRAPEISAIGEEIDRVIYPISGFRLDSNSTHEILRLLRTGPTVAVDPRTAPPGSIIVSPTQSSPYGPIYLGHAGILGSDGFIYGADARYDGARTRGFSLTSWLRNFSATNGSYAFVLHAPSEKKASGH
jgi:hypothetical protein